MENNNTFIIDDGTKEYSFKNLSSVVFAKFSINALDTGLISRYKTVENEFNEIVFNENDDADEVVKLDNKIIELFNRLLNKDISKDIFGVYTPLTLMGNGDFYCETILEKLGEIIEQEFNIRLETKKAKIKKATKKYIH